MLKWTFSIKIFNDFLELRFMDAGFSDYIIHVDESGDHSLESIDPNYPVFVLAFCIFNKRAEKKEL